VNHARALLLLARFLRGRASPGRPERLHLPDGSSEEALLYEPDTQPRATVLAIHGLNLRAQHDPRLVAVASALRGAGYRVICPRVRGLDELRVHPDISERLQALMSAVLQRVPRLGIFSASFAAGLSLQAAAQPALADRISGMLLVGTYLDAGVLLRHVLTTAQLDDYGRLIVIADMLRDELPPELLRAVDASLSDQALRPAEPQLPGVLAALSPEDQRHFWALARDPARGAELLQRIEQTRPELVQRLSALPSLPGLRAAVTLVHGRADPVIPASESQRLASLLKQRGVPVRLHISELIDHGDLASGLRAALELPALVRSVAFWLGSLEPW
jgi:pimeloyl-ACP methyl ester carboxylesterase